MAGVILVILAAAGYMYKRSVDPMHARESFDAGTRLFKIARYNEAILSFDRAIAQIAPILYPDLLYRLTPAKEPLFPAFAARVKPTEFAPGVTRGTGSLQPASNGSSFCFIPSARTLPRRAITSPGVMRAACA